MKTKKFFKAFAAVVLCLNLALLPLVTAGAANGDYKLPYEDFSKDSAIYNDNVAKAASLILYYGICGDSVMRNALANVYGLGSIVSAFHTAATEIDHFISSKKIGSGGNEYYLVSVSLVNSAGAQWYDNFDPGTGDIHRGFAAGAEYFTGIFEKYLADFIPEGKPIKLLIAGHSRGAAIANLFAKQIIDSGKYTAKENVFTYTFASPNNSKAKDLKSEKYLRIFNFVNPEDLVPRCMPEAWGYGRYGTDITLPGKTNGSGKIGGKYYDYAYYRAKIEPKFKQYSGQTFYSADNGEESLYELFKTITGRIKSVEGIYTVKMNAGISFKTMYEFFTTTVCPIISERFNAKDNDNFKNGVISLITTWLMPTTCPVYRQFTDYMMEAEGFAAARDLLKNKGADMDNITPDTALRLLLPENIYSRFGRLILSVSEFKLKQLLEKAKTAGHIFNSAHNISAYMALVTTMSETELLAPRSSNRTELETDRDIEIRRKDTGALVGRTVLGTVDKELMKNTSAVVISAKGGKLTVWLPNTENYEINYVTNQAEELRVRYRSTKPLKTVGENAEYSSGDTGIVWVDAQGSVTGAGTGSALVRTELLSPGGTPSSVFTKVTVYYAWWQYLVKYLALGFIWY